MDSLFEMHIHLNVTSYKTAALRISLHTDPLIDSHLTSNRTIAMLYSSFPSITPLEITFLNYWKTLKKDSKKNNSVLFQDPIPAELLPFLGKIKSKFIFPDHTEKYISYHNSPYAPKIFIDIAQSTISFGSADPIYLIGGTNPLVIYKNNISPLQMFFAPKIMDDLFSRLETGIPASESSFLISELQKSDSLFKKSLVIPKIVKSEIITSVFEFYYNKHNNKYELGLFLEAEIGSKKHRFPLHLENVKKFLKNSQDFAINGSDNTALLITQENPIRNHIDTIVDTSFQNFYSILGEIEDNKIITDDRVNFFENFLPKISPHADIYYQGKKNKLKVVLIEEKAKISIANNSRNPLFGSIDWLSINFEYNQHGIKLSLADLEKILQQGFIEQDDFLVSLPESEIDPLKKLLTLRKNKESEDLQIQASFLPWILSLYPDAQIPEEWQELKDFIAEGTIPHIESPSIGEDVLRDYQNIGVKRLALLHHFGFGMILADEMGLGKTLQILALLDIYQKSGKVLIVTPSALLLNWMAEIDKFYPNRFKVLIINGIKAKRDLKLALIDEYDIIITSYHMLGFDLSSYEKYTFSFCIIDEAQHIKNKKSKRAKSVKHINAQTKIAVSGTPLENNIAELWSIFDFIMPGFLGTAKQFQHDYEDPLQSFDVEKRKASLEKLYQICTPFIIRRTKDTVYKELPAKVEQTIITELTDKQKTLYLSTLSSVRDHFQTIIEENRLNSSRIDFLSALTKLRQISLHPALIYPELEKEDSELYSSKMTALLELVDEAIDSKHRILIFSQFVSMLKLIKKELEDRKIEYLYIDGKTSNRIELTDQFNKGTTPIFLISLRAGGIGLNLTGADTVILFDPWWNPAVENQAIDRAHRIGQDKMVNIYRLMTKGTIEEKIFKLQRKKDFLFDNIMQENSQFGAFSSDDLLSLISLDDLDN